MRICVYYGTNGSIGIVGGTEWRSDSENAGGERGMVVIGGFFVNLRKITLI